MNGWFIQYHTLYAVRTDDDHSQCSWISDLCLRFCPSIMLFPSSILDICLIFGIQCTCTHYWKVYSSVPTRGSYCRNVQCECRQTCDDRWHNFSSKGFCSKIVLLSCLIWASSVCSLSWHAIFILLIMWPRTRQASQALADLCRYIGSLTCVYVALLCVFVCASCSAAMGELHLRCGWRLALFTGSRWLCYLGRHKPLVCGSPYSGRCSNSRNKCICTLWPCRAHSMLTFQARLVSLCSDNSIHLWEINTRDGEAVLEDVRSVKIQPRYWWRHCLYSVRSISVHGYRIRKCKQF